MRESDPIGVFTSGELDVVLGKLVVEHGHPLSFPELISLAKS